MDVTPDITDSTLQYGDAWGRNPWDDPTVFCEHCHTVYRVSEGLVHFANEWRVRCPYCFED